MSPHDGASARGSRKSVTRFTIATCFVTTAVAFSTVSATPAVAQEPPSDRQSIIRYAQTLSAFDTRGRKVPLTIEIKLWSASGPSNPTTVQIKSSYIATVLSGDLIVVTNGVRETHAPGHYWVIPAGASVQLLTKGQAATLQTIAITDRPVAVTR
jgi:hypothetical protein